MAASFPSYFPKGCPPDEASGEERMLYRLCKGATPQESDFVPFYLINPTRFKNQFNAYGLSVFFTVEDCNSALSKSPRLREKCKYIACGLNNYERGKFLQTPSKENPNHVTWWVYEGIKPHSFFSIYGERGEIDE